tara:strand:- start:167 stop:598 length:432 start_codon:yes stop_codon:yes gene_type:complete
MVRERFARFGAADDEEDCGSPAAEVDVFASVAAGPSSRRRCWLGEVAGCCCGARFRDATCFSAAAAAFVAFAAAVAAAAALAAFCAFFAFAAAACAPAFGVKKENRDDCICRCLQRGTQRSFREEQALLRFEKFRIVKKKKKT